METTNVIVRALKTEKSSYAQTLGKYTFEVNKKATKVDIKNAVEKLFGVKVTNVNTMIVKGSEKNFRGRKYTTSDWKKAVVTIATEIKPMTYKGPKGKDIKASKKFNTEIPEAKI
mgnify:CR=1 FL=1